MRYGEQIDSGIGVSGRFRYTLAIRMITFTLFLNVFYLNSALAQVDDYNPDELFRGVQFTFDFDWTYYPAMKYHHVSGYSHDVRTKMTFGYQLGFQGQYYFNKHISIGLGALVGSSRRVKKEINITDHGVFDEYADQPDLQQWLMDFFSEPNFQSDRMTMNVSVPFYFTGHQYLSNSQRHRLDYRVGFTVRYFPALRYHNYSGGVIFNDTTYGDFYDFNGWWHAPPSVVFDLQPYLGYTFVLNNRKAVNAGIYANLAFARGRTPNELTILERTDYEESGTFTIHNHYVALRFGYVFTTPGKDRVRRRRAER